MAKTNTSLTFKRPNIHRLPLSTLVKEYAGILCQHNMPAYSFTKGLGGKVSADQHEHSIYHSIIYHYDILACWRRMRTKSGKYGPRALWSQLEKSESCPTVLVVLCENWPVSLWPSSLSNISLLLLVQTLPAKLFN